MDFKEFKEITEQSFDAMLEIKKLPEPFRSATICTMIDMVYEDDAVEEAQHIADYIRILHEVEDDIKD